jgi:hypothetical protein
VRWTGHHAPGSRGGAITGGNSAGEAGSEGREEHRRPMTFPSGKVGGSGAHRSGATPWRRWFGRGCLTAVEACGHQRRALMSSVDGEGDGGGELCTATERREKSASGGGR